MRNQLGLSSNKVTPFVTRAESGQWLGIVVSVVVVAFSRRHVCSLAGSSVDRWKIPPLKCKRVETSDLNTGLMRGLPSPPLLSPRPVQST